MGMVLALFICCQPKVPTPVDENGHLSINGTYIVNQEGKPIALKGMSLFWSQWEGQFYNYDCIKWLRDDWNCSVVRFWI